MTEAGVRRRLAAKKEVRRLIRGKSPAEVQALYRASHRLKPFFPTPLHVIALRDIANGFEGRSA